MREGSRGLTIKALEELRFEHLDDVVVAHLKGEVDLSNAQSVKAELLAGVPNTASSLVLDLSETQHLDSSGVQLVFELAYRLESRGQTLKIAVPEDSIVRRILVLTEVHQAVSLFASADAAVHG